MIGEALLVVHVFLDDFLKVNSREKIVCKDVCSKSGSFVIAGENFKLERCDRSAVIYLLCRLECIVERARHDDGIQPGVPLLFISSDSRNSYP